MSRLPILLCSLALLSGCATQQEQFLSRDITVPELQQHIRYLASDELKGRKAGEEGNRLAAQYIANEFRRYGLQPAGDQGGYFQDFTFIASAKEGSNNNLAITFDGGTLRYGLDADYRTLAYSPETTITAPLVFAGYGISAPDSLHYDDYAGLDVKDKVILVLRYSPDGPGMNRFARRSELMAKTFTARDKGAAAVIFVTSAPGKEGYSINSLQAPPSTNSGIPGMVLRWGALDSLLRMEGKDLALIQAGIDSTKTPASFELPRTTVRLQTQIIKIVAHTANILGYLPGSDPVAGKQTLIIGAHMDHLGMGGVGSGSRKPDTIAIHHGADDNASGTAGLLELAQYFGSRAQSLKRGILFTSFSAEELGTLGSEYYVNHPVQPLDSTIAMLNLDMIGRMKDSTLLVDGMGTSPGFERLVKMENADSLTLKLKPDGYGPSDHSSFYAKNLPVMFFWTNLHEDYHLPSDTWDKINYPGEQKVVELVARIATALETDSARPVFTKAAAPGPIATGGDRAGARVSLGVGPDFAEDVPGMKISGARPGTPAEKAGLQANDVIVKFAGKDVKNIYDFTYVLGLCKPGDQVEIVVKRGDKEVTLKATLEARP